MNKLTDSDVHDQYEINYVLILVISFDLDTKHLKYRGT